MRISITLIFCFGLFNLNAQDLVTNASFEYEGIAPKNFDKIHLASGWDNANRGTVDLYSSAASKYTVGIPDNRQGTQTPFDGNSYAGIIAYQDDKSCSLEESMMNLRPTAVDGYQSYSEYVQCEMSAPLVAGKRYKITYQVSLSERSSRAVSNFGAAVSETKIMSTTNAFLDVEPAFVHEMIVGDKEGWTEISGIFTAKGGEKFLTLGVFDAKNMEKTSLVEGNQPDYKRAYYYVDGLTMLPAEGVDFGRILKGDNVVLTKLNFDLGKSTIRQESFEQLDEFAAWLKSHPKVGGISIDGHTDKSGSAETNNALSKSRAEAVKTYLTNKGVTINMFARGFGSSKPLVKGGAEVNEKNRRVEISLNK